MSQQGALAEVMSTFASTIMTNKYAHDKGDGAKESWGEVARRQAVSVVAPYVKEMESKVERAILNRKFMPGGRYLYCAGRAYPQISNCFLFRAQDSREGWGRHLMGRITESLMTGGGVGVVYSDLRPEGYLVTKMGGQSTGPLAPMNMVNEAGRYIRQGGSRRSAVWAGLHWWHPDVFRFTHMKEWSPLVHQCRREDLSFPAPMDGTNISVIIDDDFFSALKNPSWSHEYSFDWGHCTVNHAHAARLYLEVIESQLRTGEPGWSVDTGAKRRHNLRNACCEVDSEDDCDNCNLASINMARVDSLDEFEELVDLGTLFLLCGSVYGVLPIPEMYQVREKNRRIGLGLMGVHEWLLKRGHAYGPCGELEKWMRVYQRSGEHAAAHARRLGISPPVATRSIAPTGTISIVAETTSGIEPVFAVAYKRRYLDRHEWKMQYVIDATAKRLIDQGVEPALVEDAYTLAEDPARRIGFQAWMQQFVDHGISSTINLPDWGSSLNNEHTAPGFAKTLLKYLPDVRGITAYPNGSRGGQPLNRISYLEAVKHLGREYIETKETGDQSCTNGFCNS